MIAVVEAFTAAARRPPADALRHARAALDHAGAIGISHEFLRWAWPLAARAAHDLARHRRHRRAARPARRLPARAPCPHAAGRTRPGPRPPGRRDGDPAAAAAFAAAISGLRELPPPTTWPMACSTTPSTSPACGDTEAATAAIGEARDIARG